MKASSQGVLSELTNLRALSQSETVLVLYGLHCKYDHDTIHENICKILKLTLECDNSMSDPELLYAWFEIHTFAYLIDIAQPEEKRKKYLNQLLEIVDMVESTKSYDEIVYKLKMSLVKQTSLNQVNKFQSLSHLEFVEKCRRRETYQMDFTCNPVSRFVDNSSENVAEYLTLTITDIFNAIRIEELVGCFWTKKDKDRIAPTISRAVNFFNFISDRVATEVLEPKNEHQRAKNIKKMIAIAVHAERLHNFELLASILAGLHSLPISATRLVKSWALVSARKQELLNKLDSTVSICGNYKNYRGAISDLTATGTSFIPILAVILRDIVYFFENNDADFSTFGKIISPLHQLRTFFPSLAEKKVTHSDTNIVAISTILKQVPASYDCLVHLSYDREMPKNLALLQEMDNDPESSSDSPTTFQLNPKRQTSEIFQENMRILRISSLKNPVNWDAAEVRLNLETWGLPADLANSLVKDYVPNGKALLSFTPTAESVPLMGLRKNLQRQITALTNQQLLINTYGFSRVKASSDVHSWTNEEVITWLKNTSYAVYEPYFKGITGSELVKLNPVELQNMGIHILGHRKGIIREICQISRAVRPHRKHSTSTFTPRNATPFVVSSLVPSF